MSIFLILGTRPQIIKSAPIVLESSKQGLDIEIVHTGQHYDYKLSQVFLEEFSLPDPVINLDVGSGSHAFQTAEIILRLEKVLMANRPSLVIVPGDANSALAGGLAPVKLGIPIAHLEAGARSYEMRMAEEINRRLLDHCSDILFAPTVNCKDNLEKESVMGRIHVTGDTMFDVFLRFQEEVDGCNVLDQIGLAPNDYTLLTLHRAENVDDAERLRGILNAIQDSKLNTIFPIHPRTKNRMEAQKMSLEDTNIRVIEPLGYVEILSLLKNSVMLLTDSGGLQKEAFWSKTPCITIRERTEWLETVQIGVNKLTGSDPDRIYQAINEVKERYDEIKNRFEFNPFGDGKSSIKIIKILKEIQ